MTFFMNVILVCSEFFTKKLLSAKEKSNFLLAFVLIFLMPSNLMASEDRFNDWTTVVNEKKCVGQSNEEPDYLQIMFDAQKKAQDYDKLSNDELDQKLAEAMAILNDTSLKGDIGDRTLLQIAFVKDMVINGTKYENVLGVFLVSFLINLNEGDYKVVFTFDGTHSLTLDGSVIDSRLEYNGSEYSYKNQVNFSYDAFLIDVVPLMKKYNEVSIKINNQRLSSVSLKGFTKAYSKIQNCFGNKIIVDMYDPF
jgi:hypothetical protein